MLIKNDISRYVYTVTRNMKTLISFMKRTVAEKHILFGAKFQFAIVIGTKVWPACAPKHFEKSIIRVLMQQQFNGCFHAKNTCGKTINEKACSGECIVPKPKGDRRMS